MTPADILRKAKAHISDAAMWHKENYFRGREHWQNTLVPDDAPCCAWGALAWASGARTGDTMYGAADRYLEMACDYGEVDEFNDDKNTTHEDIMALFDRAIALAEAAQ